MELDCEMLDHLFIMSEQKINENLKMKKIAPCNGFYGKVPDGGQWPLGSGTSIKGYKLGRVTIPDGQGWRPIEDGLCASTACSWEPEVISHGSEDYFYSLVARDLRTDWICLDALALRPFSDKELMHIEDGLRTANLYVQEEFRRSRFIAMSQNKYVAVVERNEETELPKEEYWDCVGAINNGFVFEARENGEIDESHVRVCVNPDDIDLISELTPDLLEEAKPSLALEGAGAKMVAGMLFDVMLCDQTIFRSMAKIENADMGNAASYGGYNLLELGQAWGTEGVIRNMSFRTDNFAMRFYPDAAYNTANGITSGNFDENNPETWPRFVRVYPYIPKKGKLMGVVGHKNNEYVRAPFGISCIFNPRVMEVMSFPNTVKIGGASKVGGFGYDGTVQWQNPDWQCNVNRDKGFFKLRFRLAARPEYPEEGHVWFHRINRRKRKAGVICEIPEHVQNSAVTPYCYEGIGGDIDAEIGVNAAIQNG